MQDQPRPGEILAAVAAFLRDTVAADANPRTGFQARVAANALDLVARHIALAPASDMEEARRLRAMLGCDGEAAALNARLAEGLASGSLDLATPGVAAHLWATTLEKLAVDQPGYSGYRAARAQIDQKDA